MITNKDFITMKTEVGEFVGDTTSSFLVKVGKYLNFRQRDILRRYPWKDLYATTTITTVANQATYPLPADFAEVVYVYDNTNKKKIWEAPEFGEQNDTNLTAAADYFTVKESGMLAQPTSNSTLTVTGSNAADVTQTVFIRGITSTGSEGSESVTLNGGSAVTTSNSYTTVLQVSKSAVTVGPVTVRSNGAAVTIATISPNQLQARYRQIHFYYIPSGTTSLVVRYKKQVLPMTNDYDYPLVDLADEMIFGAQADAWRAKRQFMKAAALESQYEALVAQRIFQEEQNKDNIINPTPYSRT